MRRRTATWAGIVVLVWTVGVNAQSTSRIQSEALAPRYVDAVTGLRLQDAIGRALEHEPAIRAARTETDVARGLRVQAALRPNPSVSFMQQEEPTGTDNQTRVEVQWPLDLFRRAGRVAVAEREVDATELAVADRERLLAADVRTKYGEVVAALRELAISDDLVAATVRQSALVRARVEQGSSPALERNMVDVEARRLEAERLLQAGKVEAALVALKRLLGAPADERFQVRDTLESLVQADVTVPLPSAAAPAVGTRADVQEAEARLRVADARIDRARREGRLDVSLFGMYMRMDAGFPQRGFNNAGDLERVRGLFHYVSGGAMVTVPLRNRNQGEIASAQAVRVGAEAILSAVQLTAQAEIAAAKARDDYARRAIAVYAEGARALARQNLDVVTQTYELGRATVFDVLNEQRRYLDLERAYTAALREAYEARTALRRALGDVR
jgi:cobalt-zinc-cadmium efflux system outer membrane protein